MPTQYKTAISGTFHRECEFRKYREFLIKIYVYIVVEKYQYTTIITDCNSRQRYKSYLLQRMFSDNITERLQALPAAFMSSGGSFPDPD